MFYLFWITLATVGTGVAIVLLSSCVSQGLVNLLSVSDHTSWVAIVLLSNCIGQGLVKAVLQLIRFY